MTTELHMKKVRAYCHYRTLSESELSLISLEDTTKPNVYDPPRLRNFRYQLRNAYETAKEMEQLGQPAVLDQLIYAALVRKGLIDEPKPF